MSEENEKQKPEAQVSLLSIALPILQGLLASGHYTTSDTETNETKIKRYDNGKDWKEECGYKLFSRRYVALAVGDALSLAKELLDQIKLDEAPDTES